MQSSTAYFLEKATLNNDKTMTKLYSTPKDKKSRGIFVFVEKAVLNNQTETVFT